MFMSLQESPCVWQAEPNLQIETPSFTAGKTGAESWDGTGLGSPSRLQVLSHKHVLTPPSLSSDAKFKCPQLSRCLGSLWPWLTENKARQRKESSGSHRNSPFSSGKQQLWKRDWWEEEHMQKKDKNHRKVPEQQGWRTCQRLLRKERNVDETRKTLPEALKKLSVPHTHFVFLRAPQVATSQPSE